MRPQNATWFLIVTGLTLILAAPAAFAQEGMAPPPPAADAHLEAQVGTWNGTGTMMGMAMTETATTEWALGHQFVVTRSTTTMTMPDGSQMSFEAQMAVKPNGDGTYTGMYMDSWGMLGEFAAHIDETGNYTMEWSDPNDGSTNRGVETASADGTTRTVQFLTLQPDGSWVESGSFVFTRAQ